MCGIIGLISTKSTPNSYNRSLINDIHIGLIGLQHRGQDAVGICNDKTVVKKVGLVKNLFQNMDYVEQMRETLKGNMLLGHVRYLTSGTDDESSIQPLDTNIKTNCGKTLNIKMCNNGNILNINTLKMAIKQHNSNKESDHDHDHDSALDTDSDKSYSDDTDNDNDQQSDSVLLIKLFGIMLNKYKFSTLDNNQKIQIIYSIFHYLNTILTGSYNLLIHIKDFGLIVSRDKFGIRPLSYAQKDDKYIFASEDNIYETLNYTKINDIQPGETLIYDYETKKINKWQYRKSHLCPCLFEYIYFARSDSTLDTINIYRSRQLMGMILGKVVDKQFRKILSNGFSVFYGSSLDIDMIVPVPETGRLYAYGVQSIINKPIVEALVKNRYIDRTFIMENEDKIINNIHNKFTIVKEMVKGKNILIVDDSIVRGNTSKIINKLFRKAGVKNIYFASGAPRIYFPNHYGINIKTNKELICYQNTDDQVAEKICADKVIFNDLNMVIAELKKMNPKIEAFETSIFDNKHLYKQFATTTPTTI